MKEKMKLPLILQNEIAECGHACVAMISKYWGHNLDLYAIKNINTPSANGITLLELNKLIGNLGFNTRALKVPIDGLKWIKLPAILHWNMNHFVVLKAVKKNIMIIHDPAIGIRHCKFDEVSESFTGIAVEVVKSNDFEVLTNAKKLKLYDLVKNAIPKLIEKAMPFSVNLL